MITGTGPSDKGKLAGQLDSRQGWMEMPAPRKPMAAKDGCHLMTQETWSFREECDRNTGDVTWQVKVSDDGDDERKAATALKEMQYYVSSDFDAISRKRKTPDFCSSVVMVLANECASGETWRIERVLEKYTENCLEEFSESDREAWLTILGENTDCLLDGDSSPRKQILTLQELQRDDEFMTVLKANIRNEGEQESPFLILKSTFLDHQTSSGKERQHKAAGNFAEECAKMARSLLPELTVSLNNQKIPIPTQLAYGKILTFS
ncbi:hypothetical protein E5288_WYG009678 [Bos mutus]|uniref:Uncharacterized protein n=1 Tax=Bos mutus TaxID=72004 RepID=A0A6B0R0J6_9CETA|nr:hypothetical protein [Bos mutus]